MNPILDRTRRVAQQAGHLRTRHALRYQLSVAAKKCAILAGRKRQWSGYGVAGGWHKDVTVDSGRIVL
jgi:hypothetical protein